jgi:hypothetical protein
MIKGKINDFSIVDSDREEDIFIILIVDFEDIGFFGWKHDEMSRVDCFLLELGFLRGN